MSDDEDSLFGDSDSDTGYKDDKGDSDYEDSPKKKAPVKKRKLGGKKKAASPNKKPKHSSQSKANERDAYDSDDEEALRRTKEDDRFIDSDDDNAHLLGEYNEERQVFKDERPMGLKGDIDSDDDDTNDPNNKKSEYLQSIHRLKESRKKKDWMKNKDGEFTERINEIVDDCLWHMENDYIKDEQLLSEKKPAWHQMKKLASNIETMKKKPLQNRFLDQGLLIHMNKMLQIKDGALPNLKIRTEFYKIMDKLPVTVEHLTKTSIGATKTSIGARLLKLAKHPKETTENKRMITKLVEKWSKLVFQKRGNYRDHLKNNIDHQTVEPNRMKSKLKNRGKTNAVQETVDFADKTKRFVPVETGRNGRVMIPYSSGFRFKIAPQTALAEKEAMKDRGVKVETNVTRLRKQLKLAGREGGKSQRNEKIQIDARRAGTDA